MIFGMGERLYRARAALAAKRGTPVTQGEIGDKIGVSEGQIGHWEKSRQVPSVEHLVRLAKALNTDPIWLLFGAGEMRSYDTFYAELLEKRAQAESGGRNQDDLTPEDLRFAQENPAKPMTGFVPLNEQSRKRKKTG